jgi:hypothetical protein
MMSDEDATAAAAAAAAQSAAEATAQQIARETAAAQLLQFAVGVGGSSYPGWRMITLTELQGASGRAMVCAILLFFPELDAMCGFS